MRINPYEIHINEPGLLRRGVRGGAQGQERQVVLVHEDVRAVRPFEFRHPGPRQAEVAEQRKTVGTKENEETAGRPSMIEAFLESSLPDAEKAPERIKGGDV